MPEPKIGEVLPDRNRQESITENPLWQSLSLLVSRINHRPEINYREINGKQTPLFCKTERHGDIVYETAIPGKSPKWWQFWDNDVRKPDHRPEWFVIKATQETPGKESNTLFTLEVLNIAFESARIRLICNPEKFPAWNELASDDVTKAVKKNDGSMELFIEIKDLSEQSQSVLKKYVSLATHEIPMPSL